MTLEEINDEAELRYPVKTHETPRHSPYAEMQKSFIHGLKYGLSCASQQSAALESENKRLHDVLKELVELKEMKNKLASLPPYDTTYAATDARILLINDYEARKPPAWEAARKLVKQ